MTFLNAISIAWNGIIDELLVSICEKMTQKCHKNDTDEWHHETMIGPTDLIHKQTSKSWCKLVNRSPVPEQSPVLPLSHGTFGGPDYGLTTITRVHQRYGATLDKLVSPNIKWHYIQIIFDESKNLSVNFFWRYTKSKYK